MVRTSKYICMDHIKKQQNKSPTRLARELSAVHPGYIIYAAPELACRYPSLLYRSSTLSLRTRLVLAIFCILISAQFVVALSFYRSYESARQALREESFVTAWRPPGRS